MFHEYFSSSSPLSLSPSPCMSPLISPCVGLHQVFMWGMCKGQCLLTPYETTFSSADDVFACFGSPPTMWRTIAPGECVSHTYYTWCIDHMFKHPYLPSALCLLLLNWTNDHVFGTCSFLLSVLLQVKNVNVAVINTACPNEAPKVRTLSTTIH